MAGLECPNFVLSLREAPLKAPGCTAKGKVCVLVGRYTRSSGSTRKRTHELGGARTTGRVMLMGERRRSTLGERGAQPDPIRSIAYGLPEASHDVVGIVVREWLESRVRKPKLCSCGIEMPLTGKCDDCD